MRKITLMERHNIKEMNKTQMINTAHKLPIVFVLDTSGSMNYEDNIESLNKGIQDFYSTILSDEEAKLFMEICIVTFGQGGGQLHASFGDPSKHELKPFKAEGSSPLCSAVLMALDLLEDQIDLYNENGILSHPPILITLTDGEPTTEEYVDGVPVLLTKQMDEYKIAKKRFDYFKNQMHLDAYSIYFGDDIENKFFLEQFASSNKNVKKLDEMNIGEFFKELAKSTSLLSKVAPTGDSQLVMDYDIFEDLKKNN